MKRALNGIADRGVLPRSEIRVSRVLAFVLLALVSSTAGAQCPVCTVPGTAVFPVSPNAGDQQMPAIFGDTVVWEDYRNEATTKGDIYGFDIRKLSEFPVCTAVGQQWMPSMNESRVVWQDGRANPGSITVFDLYSRDLRLGTETPVNSQAANRWNPSVWNGRVVWEELVSGANWDIKSVVMGGSQRAVRSVGLRRQGRLAGLPQRHERRHIQLRPCDRRRDGRLHRRRGPDIPGNIRHQGRVGGLSVGQQGAHLHEGPLDRG